MVKNVLLVEGVGLVRVGVRLVAGGLGRVEGGRAPNTLRDGLLLDVVLGVVVLLLWFRIYSDEILRDVRLAVPVVVGNRVRRAGHFRDFPRVVRRLALEARLDPVADGELRLWRRRW